MRILLKFPTRGRPTKLSITFSKYIQLADDPSQISVLVSLDEDDTSYSTTQEKILKRVHPDTHIIRGKSCGKIGAVNRDMEHAPPYDILILVSDDMIPVVKGYDTIIRDSMRSHYPDTDGVLFFNDGHQGQKFNPLCILGRKYYERFGYIYHPSYKSLWCDNEFTDVANQLGKQTYFDRVIIRHEHPMWSTKQYDDVYVRNEVHNEADKQNYLARKERGFKD